MFALSLFGAFEITIPTGWIGGMGSPGGSGGYASILGMGFVFTLTSFTCTVGFVGLVLVSASQGQWYQPAVGMFFFALAFSLPFFLLALFPQWLSRLPKSGGWLNSIKVVMGLLEVAFAFKFFSNVDLAWEWGLFTRPVLLALWTATAAVTGLYLLRLFRLSSDPEHDGSLGATRLLIAMGFLGFALYLSRGLFGIPLNGFIESYLPPRDMAPAFGLPEGAAAEELRWIDDYETALAQARAEGKTLFIDFTGVFCNNCRLMEQGMFPRPAIRDALGRFTLARLYTDKGTPETDANQRMQVERFGTPALPLYALVDPATEATIRSFAGMTRDEGKFLEFLTGAVASD
ncbi:MAG: Thiol:disulfide interchange protein DsbD precursor [candidate division BRC1 bacterium ADurb.BinA364]|nr:MAG: Thiol:disulfide interchange protein DsbD precursor [candidate division BRC1 bacterium ADurb.BinA364]